MPIGTHPQEVGGALTEAAQDAPRRRLRPPPSARLRARDAGGRAHPGARRARADHATNLAQAVAFNLFLRIPAAALVAVGVFATVARRGHGRPPARAPRARIVPASVITLLDHSLTQVTHHQGGGTIMIVAARCWRCGR